jgi:hypothetical protein
LQSQHLTPITVHSHCMYISITRSTPQYTSLQLSELSLMHDTHVCRHSDSQDIMLAQQATILYPLVFHADHQYLPVRPYPDPMLCPVCSTAELSESHNAVITGRIKLQRVCNLIYMHDSKSPCTLASLLCSYFQVHAAMLCDVNRWAMYRVQVWLHRQITKT